MTKTFQILLQIVLLSSIHNVKAAKILAVFPSPSISPQVTLRNFLKELSERGHEVTLVISNPTFTRDQAIENITTVNIYNELSGIWQKYIRDIVSDDNRDVLSEVYLTLRASDNIFQRLIEIADMKNLIQEKHSYFDLLLLDASMGSLLILSHSFNSPVILFSLMGAVPGNYEIVGAPIHPLLYPSIFRRRIYNLTTWEKITEMYKHLRIEMKFTVNEKKIDLFMKDKFGSVFPSVSELKGNVYALFLNNNPIWAGYHPVSPNVVFMGGVKPEIVEELTEELQSFLNNSRSGVIYMSFGSSIKPSQLPPNKLLRILNVLSEIEYDVLIKWDGDRLPGIPRKIKIYKWLPQSSLLGHPKIKLFITHGGIQSTFEAINAGVPLIGIPIYSDQWYNTEKYIKFHIGLQLDLASLTEEKLMDAISLIIGDESYRKSILELRSLMYQYPEPSLERALWWTEQVLQPYGVRHLRAPAANISWTEYLELEFLLHIVLVIFIIISVFVVVLILIIRYLIESFGDLKKKIS